MYVTYSVRAATYYEKLPQSTSDTKLLNKLYSIPKAFFFGTPGTRFQTQQPQPEWFFVQMGLREINKIETNIEWKKKNLHYILSFY